MTITQLLIGTAVLAGVLLMTALAVVPLWLDHEAERTDRPVLARRPGRAPAPRHVTCGRTV